MERKITIWLAVLVVLTMLLGGCTPSILRPKPPASAQNPPIYPGATVVSTATTKGIKNIPGKLTVMQTGDTPADVLKFYEVTLSKDGWKQETTPDGMHFAWIAGCPVHGLDVAVKSTSPGTTKIELEHTIEYCE